MAKRNSYKRSYDFLKSAAGTRVQNKLHDNNRDALVKANLRNTKNRGDAMLAAAGSSDETSEQVTASAPATAAKAKAKANAQPCFKTRRGLAIEETSACTRTSASLDLLLNLRLRRRRTSRRRGARSRAMPTQPGVAASVTSANTYMHSESKTFAAGGCQDAPQGESEHDHSDTEIILTAPASSPQEHDPRDDLREVTNGSRAAPSSITNRGEVREWILDTYRIPALRTTW